MSYSPGENNERIKERMKEIEEDRGLEEFRMGEDARKKIIEMAQEGKMVRGNLLIDTGKAFGSDTEELIDVAAAIEIIHTGLLIHDDVFDRDDERRGKEAIHSQYSTSDISEEAARNLAICAGDVAFFIGIQLVSKVQKPSIYRLFSEVFEEVGYGQMTDVVSSAKGSVLEEEEIIDFYRNKTASYTFGLPLRAACIIAEEGGLEELKEIGMEMGVLYQVKDDEIDFHDAEKNGKPALSDIREGKNTLHLSKLARHVERDQLESKVENGVTEQEAQWVLEKMDEEGVMEEVETFMEERRKELKQEISEKVENQELEQLLKGLTDFIVEREK
jgi:geranylgeranyl pyrophosphate synthase